MRPLLLLSCLLLASAAVPQKKNPSDAEIAKARKQVAQELSKKSSGNWVASKLSASALAAKVKTAVVGMKAIEGGFRMLYQTSEGRGEQTGVLLVQDKTHYRIDGTMLTPMPTAFAFVANGKERLIRRGSKVLPPMPLTSKLAGAKLAPTAYAKFFPIDFSRMMFQGLTDGVDAWGPLTQSLAQGGEGYNLRIHERTMTANGTKYLSYRLSGSRTGAALQKLGPSSYEFIIDGTRFLPVSVSVDWVDGKKKKWMAKWSGAYKFGAKLKPDVFTLKY